MLSKLLAAICTALVFVLYFIIRSQFSIYGQFWRKVNKNTEKALEFFQIEKDWHISYNKNQLESIIGKRSYTLYDSSDTYGLQKVYVTFNGSATNEKISMEKFLNKSKK